MTLDEERRELLEDAAALLLEVTDMEEMEEEVIFGLCCEAGRWRVRYNRLSVRETIESAAKVSRAGA